MFPYLAADYAGEGGPDVRAGEGGLRQSGGEEVDVARSLVQGGQLVPQRGGDLGRRGTPGASLRHSTCFPEHTRGGSLLIRTQKSFINSFSLGLISNY